MSKLRKNPEAAGCAVTTPKEIFMAEETDDLPVAELAAAVVAHAPKRPVGTDVKAEIEAGEKAGGVVRHGEGQGTPESVAGAELSARVRAHGPSPAIGAGEYTVLVAGGEIDDIGGDKLEKGRAETEPERSVAHRELAVLVVTGAPEAAVGF